MKLRVISLLLVIALTLVLIPVPASAAAAEAAELEKQIRTTYQAALRRSGKWTFNGYCGSLVNWQLYLLGIDTTKYGCDGNNEYDLYANLGTTTGGYRVKTYPASQYDLRSALNAITKNGTVDAYNIMVGFQRTNTAMGSIYGHALLIHGILDGIVYFVECFSTSLGGKYWSEGTPISCSIDTFCDYYNRWTVFDGIAYFGLKTYADACQEYPASMHAIAVGNTDVYAEPDDPGLYSAAVTGSLLSGELVKVTALLQAPGGGYWYQLDRDGAAEYVQAEKLMPLADCYDDVKLSELRAPTVIRKGSGFVLRGIVSSLSSQIHRVNVSVYAADDPNGEPVMEGTLDADGKSVNLNTWQLDRYMTFRLLQAGTYRITVTAEAQNCVLKNGILMSNSKNILLWDSEFQVVTDWNKYVTVSFDGNGGNAALRQTAVASGSALGTLPEASRPGYTLTGWTLDPDGSSPVAAAATIGSDTTLYAQWELDGTEISGSQHSQSSYSFYINGVCVTSELESDRTVIQDWQRPGGALMAAGTALRQTASNIQLSRDPAPDQIQLTGQDPQANQVLA